MSSEGQLRIHQIITGKMIEALKKGVVPWHRPWAGSGAAGYPVSMSTKRHYRGVNVWLLGLTAQDRGYRSPWWGTYNQITALGGQVRTGQNRKNGTGSTTVILSTHVDKGVDDEGNAQGFQLMKMFNVFNAEQCEGLPEWCYPTLEERGGQEGLQEPDGILKAYYARPGSPSFIYTGTKAHYFPETDRVECPPPEMFDSPQARCSTEFHEAVHSTGHAKRLGRPGIEDFDHFGSERYASEELVAEMGAAILCMLTGITDEDIFSNSAAYVANWLSKLQDDPKLVIRASSAASKAVNLILGKELD